MFVLGWVVDWLSQSHSGQVQRCSDPCLSKFVTVSQLMVPVLCWLSSDLLYVLLFSLQAMPILICISCILDSDKVLHSPRGPVFVFTCSVCSAPRWTYICVHIGSMHSTTLNLRLCSHVQYVHCHAGPMFVFTCSVCTSPRWTCICVHMFSMYSKTLDICLCSHV